VDIGERLAYLRKERKLSQAALAERSGLSQTYISDIEKKGKQPTYDTMLKLCNGLGISLIELLGGESFANSLPSHLSNLLNRARNLTPNQIEALNQFIGTITEKNKEDAEAPDGSNPFSPEYIAAHRTDNPMDDLPDAARESVIRFKKMVTKKRREKE